MNVRLLSCLLAASAAASLGAPAGRAGDLIPVAGVQVTGPQVASLSLGCFYVPRFLAGTGQGLDALSAGDRGWVLNVEPGWCGGKISVGEFSVNDKGLGGFRAAFIRTWDALGKDPWHSRPGESYVGIEVTVSGGAKGNLGGFYRVDGGGRGGGWMVGWGYGIGY